MIQFSCPKCSAVYEVADELAGRSVDCGNCRRPMTVPEKAIKKREYVAPAPAPPQRTIRFSCPKCDAAYEVAAELAGRNVDCGNCRRPMSVPFPSDESFEDADESSGSRFRPRSSRERDIRLPQYQQSILSETDLTSGEILMCIFCAGIGCFVGLYLTLKGSPKGGKMMGLSILFIVIWNFLYFVLTSLAR